jgi:hypothetical protein
VSSLGPSLTAYDRRVLMAARWQRTAWEIAEALDQPSVDLVLEVLERLGHLGCVASRKSQSRGRMVWWRTQRGDEAL